MAQTFVIIDGSSLVHRAFYALPLLSTANGQYTNAVYGFATMLVKLLTDVKPDSIVVAFDKGRVTFRNEKYTQYKAHRKPTPTELSEQFPLVKELLTAFGIQAIEQEGFEADDIIGTLATKAAVAGCDVIIVTGDRDALQLINAHIRVMLTKKGISEMETFDNKAFKEKYSVEAEQLIDIKGLMGDTSDNIPGVPGVGEKTAIKLISEFGSVENVLNNIDKISGVKLKQKLQENAELALLSKQLATIIKDMPLAFSAELFEYHPDRNLLQDLFIRFEFKSLFARIEHLLPGNTEESVESIEDLPAPEVVTQPEQIREIINDVRKNGLIQFYPLMTGDAPVADFTGMAVAYKNSVVYVPEKTEGWMSILELLVDPQIKKVTYDLKPIYGIGSMSGLLLKGGCFDILIAAYLLEPTAAEYPLDDLARKYLYLQRTWSSNKTEQDAAYAAWACKVISDLYPVLSDQLDQSGLSILFDSIEMPLVEVLVAMEENGITVDAKRLREMSVEISQKIDILLADIYLLAGEHFNVNSTKQLGVILFEKLKLPVIKKTKTGYSTDAEVLEKLAGTHSIIDKLLEYRVLTKLKSTYLDGLLPLINSQTGRIHTSFNQTVTATGRLSSSEPNLQNIPIRSDIGRRIRELFVPGDGYQFIMSADYSQIELRILAHMSNDDTLIAAFNHDEDIHTRTASKVFGVPIEEVTPEMRSRAKAVNFGIVYGISDYGLSRDIGVSRKEAGQYIDSYFEKYHGVKSFIDAVVNEAHHKGYVTTILGRRRYLPDINSGNFNRRSFAERTAMNTPIQGTAADVIKKAMIDVYRLLQSHNLNSRILLQVHDELVLEVVQSEVDQVKQLVKQAMEEAVNLNVKLVAEVKLGKNWAEAK